MNPLLPLEPVASWSLVIGLVFTLAALGRGPLRRWPVSMSALYLVIGGLIGPWGIGLLDVDLIRDVKVIEAVTEIAVLVSLLTAGLQLSPSLTHLRRSPIPLATVTMVITIAGIAVLGYFVLAMPIGAAVLLGAVLAPTDPVLAGEVQVRHHDDTDRLRYALTGEAGLNDGAAFPFVMLGLGLLGLHQMGDYGWRWVAVDLVWATAAGIGIGWACGYVISSAAVWMKQFSQAPAACEELLTLGLIGLSYGVAMALHAYGFLAVFAAGVATRRYAEKKPDDEDANRLMVTVTNINEQFGQIIEVALVVLIGSLVTVHWSVTRDWWIALTVFFVFRPIGVAVGLFNQNLSGRQKHLVSFFGIRGIGSLYYLSYAIDHGLDESLALRLGSIVLTTIALSVVIHSNAASILPQFYRSRPSDNPRSEEQGTR